MGAALRKGAALFIWAHRLVERIRPSPSDGSRGNGIRVMDSPPDPAETTKRVPGLHLLRQIAMELPLHARVTGRRPQKAEVSGFFVRLA